MKVKKPKLIPLKKMTKELDTLWSLVVRNRDKRCRLCGSTNSLQAHHIIFRVESATKYDVENGVTLCMHCHLFVVHKDTVRSAFRLISAIGEDRWNRLKEKSNNPELIKRIMNMNKAQKREYYQEIKEDLQKQLESPVYIPMVAKPVQNEPEIGSIIDL